MLAPWGGGLRADLYDLDQVDFSMNGIPTRNAGQDHFRLRYVGHGWAELRPTGPLGPRQFKTACIDDLPVRTDFLTGRSSYILDNVFAFLEYMPGLVLF